MFHFVDDANQTRAKELKLTLSTLYDFQHCIARTLQAWDAFELQEIQVFQLPPIDPRYQLWDSHLSTIRRHITELRQYELRLTQRIEHFKGMEDSVRLLPSVAQYDQANLTDLDEQNFGGEREHCSNASRGPFENFNNYDGGRFSKILLSKISSNLSCSVICHLVCQL